MFPGMMLKCHKSQEKKSHKKNLEVWLKSMFLSSRIIVYSRIQIEEGYLKLCETSVVEFFEKIVNDF